MSKVIISLVVGVGFFIAGMIVAKRTDNISGRNNGHDYDDDGGYDDDDVTFRPFEPRLETSSVFAWKRHRTFSEASRVFLDTMRARLEE